MAMDMGQKTRGHTNGGKGMGIMLAKRQSGISCRGYRGLGKMDRGQENGRQWKRGGREWKQRTEESKQEETAEHLSGDRGQGDTGDRGQGIGGTGGNG